VIRQSISCDMCGAQRRETNHWFIAYEHAGELRVGDWTSQRMLSPGTRHICGERCLHKLMSEFLARAVPAGTLRTAACCAPRQAVDSTEASAHSQRQQPTSNPSRSGQYANRALEDDQHRYTGKRTSC
jgi:hypothetical protein